MTVFRPFRYGGVTCQWQPTGDHCRLIQSGKPVADIIPDGRYAAMHRLKLPGEPISDMVNLTRAKDAALRRIGSKRAPERPERASSASPPLQRLSEQNHMRFFKYVTTKTAKTILENGTLRWSSPSIFNDPFDVQFDLHLEFDQTKIVDLIADELWQLYSRQKKLEPANSLGQVFNLFLSHVPGLSREDIFGRQGLREAMIESINLTETRLPELHAHQRSLLKDAKLLCLSEINDSILMWSHYSENHRGAVLEFACDKRSDSVLNKAERVTYSATMPRLMNEEDMVRFFSGQWRMDANVIMRNGIFVKAVDWSYEKEWRVWLPGENSVQEFTHIQFKREELVGIYFGCRMSEQDQTILLESVKKHFPNASAYQARKSAREFALQFEAVR
jgi:hypothetical protein